ncbi:DUF1810 domain-containing protein [Halorubellus litoreus]|uniref:DUF1810 domain-containing protein n=1 Tax=Halorubellus litoreus TaxID=755308 RepID=A0ABD5VNS1_9EURY
MTGDADPDDLERFVSAQEQVIGSVKRELRGGRKRSHWMWFVFPQIAGLGRSEMAQRYAIDSLEEAKAYLAHPVLGPRLRDCTELVLDIEDKTANEVFGSPDDLKFRSSMTLFEIAADDGALFADALEKYYDGDRDAKTLELVDDN